MKKVFLGLMLAFSLIVSVTLTACGGGNGGNGGGEQNYTTAQKEYNAFKDKAFSIIDSYNLVISETTGGASAVSSKTDEEETSNRKALIKDIYETVSTNERSESVENFGSSAKNFFKQIFVSPLVFGEVLTFNSNSATFYDTVGKASTADGNVWYVLKKNGDHTTFYSLDNTYQTYDGQKTGHIYYDLYYRSESDFNFLCITEISSGNFVFFSGDSDYNFAYVNYDVDSQSSTFVTVFDGVNALNIGGSSDFAKSCVDKVKNAQDMAEIKSQTNALSLSENPVLIDMNDFATVAKKYEDQIGNGNVNMSSDFEMDGDTLVGVRNYSKETLVIPKYVKSIDAQSFRIPENVKKLVVSENLKELVVKKYMLDYNRNETNYDSTYVSCPFDFFGESKPFFSYNRETRAYNEVEITVLGNDGVFKQDAGGNIYLNLKPTASSEERHDYILELKNMNYLAKKANIEGFSDGTTFVIDSSEFEYGNNENDESLYVRHLKESIPELTYMFGREEDLKFDTPKNVEYIVSWDIIYGVNLKSYFDIRDDVTFENVKIYAKDKADKKSFSHVEMEISEFETINNLVFGENMSADISLRANFYNRNNPRVFDDQEESLLQKYANKNMWPKVKNLDLGECVTGLRLGNVLVGSGETLNKIACPDSMTTFSFDMDGVISSDYVIEGKNGGYAKNLTFDKNYTDSDLDEKGRMSYEYSMSNRCPINFGFSPDDETVVYENGQFKTVGKVADGVRILVKTNAPLRKFDDSKVKVMPTELWLYTIQYYNDDTDPKHPTKFLYPKRAILKIEQDKDTVVLTTREEYAKFLREDLLEQGYTDEDTIQSIIQGRLESLEYNPDIFDLDKTTNVYKTTVKNEVEKFDLDHLVGKREWSEYNWRLLRGNDDAQTFDEVKDWKEDTRWMEELELKEGNNFFKLNLLHRVGDTIVDSFETVKINVYRNKALKIVYHISNGMNENEAIFDDPTFEVQEGTPFAFYDAFSGVTSEWTMFTHPIYSFKGWYLDSDCTVPAFAETSKIYNAKESTNGSYSQELLKKMKFEWLKVKDRLLNTTGDDTENNFWVKPSDILIDTSYSYDTSYERIITKDLADANGEIHIYSKWEQREFEIELDNILTRYTDPVLNWEKISVKRGKNEFFNFDGNVTMPTANVDQTDYNGKKYGTFMPENVTVKVSVCGEDFTLNYYDLVNQNGAVNQVKLGEYVDKIFLTFKTLLLEVKDSDGEAVSTYNYNLRLSFKMTTELKYEIFELNLAFVDNFDILSQEEAFIDGDENLNVIETTTRSGESFNKNTYYFVNVYKYLNDPTYKNKSIKYAYANTTDENGNFVPGYSQLMLKMPGIKKDLVDYHLCDDIDTALFDKNGNSVLYTSSTSSYPEQGLNYRELSDNDIYNSKYHTRYYNLKTFDMDDGATIVIMPRYKFAELRFVRYNEYGTLCYVSDTLEIKYDTYSKITEDTKLQDLLSVDYSKKEIVFEQSIFGDKKVVKLSCDTTELDTTETHELNFKMIDNDDPTKRQYAISLTDLGAFIKKHFDVSGGTDTSICKGAYIIKKGDSYTYLGIYRIKVVYEETT